MQHPILLFGDCFFEENYLDVLVKIAHYQTVAEYAKSMNKSTSWVYEKRKRACHWLAKAAFHENKNLFTEHVLWGLGYIAQIEEEAYNQKIQQYIDQQPLAVWEKIPHEQAVPTPYELIDFLLDFYHDRITRWTTDEPYPHGGLPDFIICK